MICQKLRLILTQYRPNKKRPNQLQPKWNQLLKSQPSRSKKRRQRQKRLRQMMNSLRPSNPRHNLRYQKKNIKRINLSSKKLKKKRTAPQVSLLQALAQVLALAQILSRVIVKRKSRSRKNPHKQQSLKNKWHQSRGKKKKSAKLFWRNWRGWRSCSSKRKFLPISTKKLLLKKLICNKSVKRKKNVRRIKLKERH